MKRKFQKSRPSHVTILLITALTVISRTELLRADELCNSDEHFNGTAKQITPQMTLKLVDGSKLRLANIELIRRPDLIKLNKWLAGKKIEYFSTGRVKDRHNNLLAQVFINAPNEKIWLQAHFISNGLALASALPTVNDCFASLAKFEARARLGNEGIWNKRDNFRIYQADDLAGLNKLPQASFQIIEGRVNSVGKSRQNIFINFGKNWKTDFTALIEKRLIKRKHHNWPNLNSLIGKKIRVRGWLDHWHGPMIRLHTPKMLEILGDD